MPKDDKRKELTQEEIDAQNEKFRTFFSTSVGVVLSEDSTVTVPTPNRRCHRLRLVSMSRTR